MTRPACQPNLRTSATAVRRRSAGLFAVYDSVAEADAAAAFLARQGITGAQISAVVAPATAPGRTAPKPTRQRLLVLVRGRPGDADQAHEILADAAARAHVTV